MERARIIIIEDRENIRSLYRELLEFDGHEVVGEAADSQEADTVIEQTDAADIAIVDRHYGPSEHEVEGERVVEALRKKFGDTILVVDISGEADWEPMAGADVRHPKSRPTEELLNLVKLHEPFVPEQ